MSSVCFWPASDITTLDRHFLTAFLSLAHHYLFCFIPSQVFFSACVQPSLFLLSLASIPLLFRNKLLKWRSGKGHRAPAVREIKTEGKTESCVCDRGHIEGVRTQRSASLHVSNILTTLYSLNSRWRLDQTKQCKNKNKEWEREWYTKENREEIGRMRRDKISIEIREERDSVHGFLLHLLTFPLCLLGAFSVWFWLPFTTRPSPSSPYSILLLALFLFPHLPHGTYDPFLSPPYYVCVCYPLLPLSLPHQHSPQQESHTD